MGRLQFNDLGEILGACQSLGQVEAGIYVPLGDVDDFAVERCSTLASSVESPFKLGGALLIGDCL